MKKNFFWLSLLSILFIGCGGTNPPVAVVNQNFSNPIENKSPQTLSPNASENKPSAKTYAQMSEEEKNKFIAEQSDKILEKFGRVEGDKVNETGLKSIRAFVDSFTKRDTSSQSDNCKFGDDLSTILTRGAKYGKTISDEFNNQSLPVYLGIYVPMIETEYCPCLQAPTGPLGMFQLTSAMGQNYGLNTKKDASSKNPDDRCDPQLSARAAAKYMKFVLAKNFADKTDAITYPLLISSYNRGEGLTDQHIKAISEQNGGAPVSFWTLLDTESKVKGEPVFLKQFQMENKKYVPKFFAAVIIGENPQVFGVNTAPLSESK